MGAKQFLPHKGQVQDMGSVWINLSTVLVHLCSAELADTWTPDSTSPTFYMFRPEEDISVMTQSNHTQDVVILTILPRSVYRLAPKYSAPMGAHPTQHEPEVLT